MAELLSPVPKLQFFDNNGKPAVGYKLFTYSAGTSTKLATYTDSTGNTSNPNPIVLDYRGEASVWVPPNVPYKYVLAAPNDTDPPGSPIWSVDNLVGAQLVTLWGGVDTGVANAYVLDFDSNFTSYTDGIVIYWLPSNTNTGPSTINVNGLGPVPILNQDGSDLYVGQIQANQVTLIVYRSGAFSLVAVGVLPSINTKNQNYTLAISDANAIVENSSAVRYEYTVPANSSVPFAEGTSITVVASGSGGVTIKAAPGVDLHPYGSSAGSDISILRYASTTITKVGPNQWLQSVPSDLPSGLYSAVEFSGSITGLTSSELAFIDARKCGGIVTLLVFETSTGTSNATTLTITGLPAEYRPVDSEVTVPCFGVIDSGASISAIATIGTDGVITFGTAPNNTTTGFANTGTKGVAAGLTLVFNRGML